MHGILRVLDLSCAFDILFWAACLVFFFSFFFSFFFVSQICLYLPVLIHRSTNGGQMSNFPIWSYSSSQLGLNYSVQTAHFTNPLPHIPKSPFCPSSALLICFRMLPSAAGQSPLFCYPSSNGPKPITHVVLHLVFGSVW